MDQAADLVIRNARVYTLDSERPWVEAIAVKGDRISYVGSDEGAEEYVGESTRLIAQASVRRLSMYKTALEEGHLKSRLQIALYHPPGTTQKEVDRFAEARRDYNDDRIRVSAIKLYIDDVIEPHTAALLEPYADLPGERGDTFYAPETFNEVVTRLDAQGFQLFIHAIGDRGIRVALDALEHARRANGPRDSRHQLVHVELLSPEDIPRFKGLDVTACM